MEQSLPPHGARAGKPCSLDSEVRAQQLGALGKFQDPFVPQLPALQVGTSSSWCPENALVSRTSLAQPVPFGCTMRCVPLLE